MITGGNATVFVSDMDRAVEFYTEILGLKLLQRFENHWATVAAGASLTLGLHPISPKYPAPGTKGGMMLGLEIDEPIEKAMEQLKAKGVTFTREIERSPQGNFVHFEDLDGSELYLWETVKWP